MHLKLKIGNQFGLLTEERMKTWPSHTGVWKCPSLPSFGADSGSQTQSSLFRVLYLRTTIPGLGLVRTQLFTPLGVYLASSTQVFSAEDNIEL